MRARRATQVLVPMVAAVVAATVAPMPAGAAATHAQQAPRKKIVVEDRRGEARPDITSLRARPVGDRVKLSIRLRDVRSGTESLTLYVRNAAGAKKPQLALVTGLSPDGGGYDVWRTRGWKVQYGDDPTEGLDCDAKVRIGESGSAGRVVKIWLGQPCLGTAGKVRFGVRATRSDADGDRVDVDWLTARKRLTPAVRVP